MKPKEFVDSLIKYGLATNDELKGCSEHDIEILERHIDNKLPKIYRELLLLIGHNSGLYNRGTNFLYKDLFTITNLATETMRELSVELPSDAFVISSHQGCIFAYFRLSEGDNPPVYSCSVSATHTIRFADSFSEYLEKSLKEATTFSNPQIFSLEDYIRENRK